MTAGTLKAPYPFFGGKRKIAGLVWERFGKPENYCEPFFGSGAVLLGCPWPGHTETCNDADAHIANFWRAVSYDAEAVALYCDYPVSEVDLHSWHRKLVDMRGHVERMMADPEYYDAELAGRWCWGISQWIGTGWCPPSPAGDAGRGIHRALDVHAGLPVQLPMLHGDSGASGRGVHAKKLAHKRPVVAGTGGRTHHGLGVHRQGLAQKMPFIASPSPDRKQYGLGVHGIRLSEKVPYLGGGHGGTGRGVETEWVGESGLYPYFRALQARLRRVRVCCGDFERILGPSVTWRHGMTAVFLDPPYADGEHAITYSGGGNVWERTCRWCEANGENPLLRIALCGYADTWEAPPGWTSIRWRTSGGYGSQGNARGRENANRETIWFSPHCLNPAELARDALSRPIRVSESEWVGTMFEEAPYADD